MSFSVCPKCKRSINDSSDICPSCGFCLTDKNGLPKIFILLPSGDASHILKIYDELTDLLIWEGELGSYSFAELISEDPKNIVFQYCKGKRRIGRRSGAFKTLPSRVYTLSIERKRFSVRYSLKEAD